MKTSEARLDQMLEAIINDTKYTDPPTCTLEEILKAILDGEEYTNPPTCRLDDLMLQLKEKIEQGGGGTETLLWENPSPNSAMGATNVEISNLNDFDSIKIVWKSGYNTTKPSMSVSIPIETFNTFATNDKNVGMYLGSNDLANRRGVYRLASGGVCFTVGAQQSTNNTQNYYCIPLAIYGIK